MPDAEFAGAGFAFFGGGDAQEASFGEGVGKLGGHFFFGKTCGGDVEDGGVALSAEGGKECTLLWGNKAPYKSPSIAKESAGKAGKDIDLFGCG